MSIVIVAGCVVALLIGVIALRRSWQYRIYLRDYRAWRKEYDSWRGESVIRHRHEQARQQMIDQYWQNFNGPN